MFQNYCYNCFVHYNFEYIILLGCIMCCIKKDVNCQKLNIIIYKYYKYYAKSYKLKLIYKPCL